MNETPADTRVPSGRRLLTGTAWNAAGRGLPLLLALLLTPLLLGQLGLDRWGLFTLALGLVGVFGLFDLGLGPALTRALAERLGSGGSREGEAELVAAAVLVLAAIGAAGAALLWWAMPALVGRVLNVPPALQEEAVRAFRVLLLAAPLVVVNAALWGVLAAHQRFRAANLASIPVAVFYYLGPLLALLAWDSLVAVMLALVACRLANTLSYAWLAWRLLPGLARVRPRLAAALPLLRLGGWMSVSGALTQALLQADRFLIGALLSLAAVAYYATPLDLVMRMWILPVAVAQALLPALAAGFRARPEETAALLRRGALLIAALVLPASLALVAFAETILRLWLGAEFAAGGATVLRILGVGILFSCVGFAPGSLLDAIGRPDAAARFALAQAAVYLPAGALLLFAGCGIEGMALAWSARAAVECAGRLWLAARLYPPAAAAARGLLPGLAWGGAGLAAVAALAEGAPGVAAPVAAAGAVLAGFAALAWRCLAPAERAALRAPRGLLRPGGVS
ncbi:oligosaccharide flippase family protein [Caldovatus aquaticus]|uniref:Oligosaccharide flippase family protein n=1 Tax=Caldovatus aquaticus TaxID=2865671 RepID=A0ABS7F2Y5_9PROT|nr:oligosaccharide flippase family protein [Caldovatus aquaticus]MBW8269873.1 oligosaccharide flippase family protein [Caldovatus aquaticus]